MDSNSVSQEFKQFAFEWEFTHKTSSPRSPRSNGQAERCIQTVKNLLKKADESNGDPNIALLEYRNSPLDGVGLSPAQLLMNRTLRSKLPTSKTWLEFTKIYTFQALIASNETEIFS